MRQARLYSRGIPALIVPLPVTPRKIAEPLRTQTEPHRELVVPETSVCKQRAVQIPLVFQPVRIPVVIAALEIRNIKAFPYIVAICGKRHRKAFHRRRRIGSQKPAERMGFRATYVVGNRIGIAPGIRHFQIGIVAVVQLRAQSRARHVRSRRAGKRSERIVTNKFTSVVMLEHRIVVIGPCALLQAFHVVFQPKARHVQVEVRMAELARSRIEAHYVVIVIGIVFHADFIFGGRHAQPLEIQKATGIIHLVILAAFELFAVYPYGF